MYSNFNKALKKIIIIFLLITLTYSNFVLVGSNIMKGLISYAKDETEISLKELLITNQELKTNKIYQINGEEKRVIQIELETGINSNEYPIKETNITLKTNIIDKTLEDVKVTSINTNSYTKGTWVVEGEEIKINLINEAEELKEKPEGLDKLLVTYIFQYEEKEKIEHIEKAIKSVEIKTYKKAEASRTFEGGRFEEIELENDILTLTIENKDIHKTTIKEEKVAYKETINMDLGYRRDISKFTIEDIINDIYKEETINEEVKVKYLKTIINKEDLVNLLGEEGLLTMFDVKTGKTVAKITKEYLESLAQGEKTEQKIKDEGEETEELRAYITAGENNIEIEYVEEILKLQIKFENIAKQSENEIENAKFKIENEKEIINIKKVEDIDYLLEKVKYTIEDEEGKEIESKITFKDTITKAMLEVDNKEWEVGKINKVNYTITLDTKTEKTDLFEDPVFLLEMPKNVEVKTENSKFTIENDNGAFPGKKVFVATVLERQYVAIILEGKQTAETIEKGKTQIKLALELNVKENATQEETTTKLYYQNSGVTAYESGVGFDSAEVDVTLVLKNEEQEEIEEEKNTNHNLYISLISMSENATKQGDNIEYIVCINNYKKEEEKNLQLKDVLPEGVTLQKVVELIKDDTENTMYSIEKEIDYEYDENTNTLSVNIEKLEPATEVTIEGENTYLESSVKMFKIIVKTESLKEGYSKEIKNKAEIILGEEKVTSNEVTNIISDAFLEINLQKIEDKISENQNIKFLLTVTNKGLFDATQKEYNLNAPNNVEFLNVKYGYIKDDQKQEKGTATINNNTYKQSLIDISAGEIFYVEIEATIKKQEEDTIFVIGNFDEKEVKWELEFIENEEAPSNPTEPENPTEPTGPETPTEPENPTEPTEPENPTKPENPTEPTQPETPTEPDIPIEPIDKDNTEKPVTPEKPNNTNKPTISEEERTEGFDLNLKQYLTKITVTNTQGTTTYNYEDTNFAKVEIPAKYMNGSTVTFEYKIIVGNAGTIPGYARKIVDYLPEGLNFNSELNTDWYIGDDGNLYSVALIDKILNPGETEELKVILTKNMTNNNTGTIANIVEIYEASNDDNLEDINSIPGDKIEGQNDMSKVEVIIAVRTGKIIMYIILTMLILAILAFGINKIRKNVLKSERGC